MLGGGPQQPAASAAADHDHYYSSVDDLAMDMANPQQPAARASAVHDHYYSSADDLAMDMADSQLGPAVLAPVEVGGLSGHVSVCLSAGEMFVLYDGWSTSLSLCAKTSDLWTCVCLSVCQQEKCPSCIMICIPICLRACVFRPMVSGLVSVCRKNVRPV